MARGKQLQQIFEERVREAPQRVAVRAVGRSITYRELDARAEALSRRLEDLGVGPDVLVGLCLERGIELIVGLLGILKAGGAYVPIDPGYPKKRIDFLLADSGAAVVVTGARAPECLEGAEATLVGVDHGAGGTPRARSREAAHDPASLAYVIYTSGSSGTPKGVLIEHRHVARLFERTDHWFRFDRHDVWMLFHSISFDFSVWEIWGALLHGGTLVIVPAAVARSAEQLRDLIREERVTVLCQTPSAFQRLVAAELRRPDASESPLRLVIFGGEALDLGTLRPWAERYGLERPALVNMYGITETTVHVTYKPITARDLERPELSLVGTPIPDLEIHLLDAAGAPVPEGVPGEIHVAGAGVARGYLNRPELDAQRFLTRPDGTRMYRSGDRAVRLPDGELAYLGRNDAQIKVRGFRIEPREIELCLAAHEAAGSVSVLAHDYGEGDVRLLAFVVARPGLEPDPAATRQICADLAARAASELPPHMRPSLYVVLRELPTTPHGKLDREELLRLAMRPQGCVARPPAPGSATEQAVAAIWEEILQRDGVGLDDDFFEIGGTSLALMRILAGVNERFRVRLNGSEMGDELSISRLSACVDDARRQTRELQSVGRE